MTGDDPLEYLREEMEARPFAFSNAMTRLAAYAESEWHDLRLASALRLAGSESLRILAERQEAAQVPPSSTSTPTPEGKGGAV